MPKNSKHDAALKKEIDDSLKTSSYLDKVYDQIADGTPISEGMVPDYSGGMTKSGGMKTGGSTSNESGMHPDVMLATDALFRAAAGATGHSAPAAAPAPMTKYAESAPFIPPVPEHSVSPRQLKALQKYPALIEVLGGAMGDKIVSEILIKVNGLMVSQLEKNAKGVSKYAQACVADKQNIKQYYAGEDKEWACQVIASGPFRGDETIFFDRDKDKSMVLRKSGKQFDNVSKDFNVIHEFVQAEVLPEVVETPVEDTMPAIVEGD